MYANVSDEQYQQLVDALHRQWRVATRAVMILLSTSGMPARRDRRHTGPTAANCNHAAAPHSRLGPNSPRTGTEFGTTRVIMQTRSM